MKYIIETVYNPLNTHAFPKPASKELKSASLCIEWATKNTNEVAVTLLAKLRGLYSVGVRQKNWENSSGAVGLDGKIGEFFFVVLLKGLGFWIKITFVLCKVLSLQFQRYLIFDVIS